MPVVSEINDDLINQLLALPDEQAIRDFLARPEVSAGADLLVEKLAGDVDVYNRRQPQHSLKLAKLALLAAEVNGESGNRARACRAQAHALRSVGRSQE